MAERTEFYFSNQLIENLENLTSVLYAMGQIVVHFRIDTQERIQQSFTNSAIFNPSHLAECFRTNQYIHQMKSNDAFLPYI
ncbi:hypothetical protein EHN46_15840 [Salmonella enterica]|nr:hypothetical protein [Salmonella enterica]